MFVEVACHADIYQILADLRHSMPLGARTALTFALEDGTLFVRGFHDDKEAFSARCEYDPV